MRTMKLEIDGKTEEVQIFDSMWEYIDHHGATVEDYQLSPASHEEKKKIGSFKPVDDVFFHVGSSYDWKTIDRKVYAHVNWGEDEYVLIPEDDIDAEFYLIWEWNERISGYDTRGQIFQTEEEARKAIQQK